MAEENAPSGDQYYIEAGDMLPATPEPDEELHPWSGPTEVVGSARPRIDAYERVSGTATYTYDVILPDMLHAAILRCPHPHARVRSIDTSEAERLPGVRAIISHETPGTDIPWYARTGQPQSFLFDPHCRYEGEEVAAVAAETPQQAWDAVRAIRVEYEELPSCTTPEEALAEGAPSVHEGSNLDGDVVRIRSGDVEQGFAEADVVVEDRFSVGTHIHTPMESFGSVAKWEGKNLTIWDSTQGVYSVMGNVARALNLSYNNVRVICPYMGGGFGAKLRTGKYVVIAALLARTTARPVKLFLTREETFRCVGNRPGAEMTMRAGAKRDGTLTALELTNVSSGGAYGGNRYIVSTQVFDLYRCPNVRTEETWAYTHTGEARAMRAPGFPQCSFALEQIMDKLADALEMDPIELRLKNIPMYSQWDEEEKPFSSTGLSECLTRGAESFGWSEARSRSAGDQTGTIRRGVGVAACNWWAGNGGPPSTATVNLFSDGSVTIRTGASDIGTGTKTVAAMVVAEELHAPVDRINVVHADTGTTPYHYVSGGSQTLPGAIPAIRLAAHEVKKRVLAFASEDLGHPASELELRDHAVTLRTDASVTKDVGAILGDRDLREVVGVGYRGPNPEDSIVRPFGAQFAEVEVNTLTGEVEVLRLLGAHDSGRVINRTTYDSQVIGGMVQGLGFGMTEHRVMDRNTGKLCTGNWHDYKIPTALDVPADHESLPIDPGDDTCNNLGAKGLGEPPAIPTAAAIANAVYDAIGVRVTAAPISTPNVLAALRIESEVGQ